MKPRKIEEACGIILLITATSVFVVFSVEFCVYLIRSQGGV